MSNYENQNHPQYNIDPGMSPQQPPPVGQPPIQVYGQQPPPPPHMGGGGQPPMQPPGGYAPMAPPPPQPKRTGRIVIASILSVALLLGIGAFVFFQFIWTSGPDPAERFPASATAYVELNLDPSFDQTPKLFDHLSKFEGVDVEDVGDVVTQFIEETGIEGVEPDDINSWLGRRHGFAMWEHDGMPYGIVNLASTDAEAAEDGLATIRDVSGVSDEEWAYQVEDDAVLMVVGDSGAADALNAAVSESESSTLSDSSSYDEARSWLDGDQLLVSWVDLDGIAGMMGEEVLDESFGSMLNGSFITGLSAFDDGFELSYRLFSEDENPWTGSDAVMDRMGELPAASFAATGEIPENLSEYTEEWVDELEDYLGDDYTATEEPDDSDGGSDLAPLTSDEYIEYEELDEKYWSDELTSDEEARYEELDDRYWACGTEDVPYCGDDGYEDDYDSGTDYGEMMESADELVDMLAGAQLSFAFDYLGEDDFAATFEAHLADDRAQDLEDLINELAGGELPDGAEVDGSSLSFTQGEFSGGTLSEDDRFDSFADAAPDNVAVAAWLDLSDLDEEYTDMGPLSAVTWAHGSEDGDGVGLARLYLD